MTDLSTTTAKPKVKLASLKADRDKEREGDWIVSDIDPGIRFFVRSTNFAPFKIERDHRQMKLARKYGDDPIPDEVIAELTGSLAVKHLLLDWEGFDEPFSSALALEVLTDEAYRRVRTSVFIAATRVGQAEVQYVEETAKN